MGCGVILAVSDTREQLKDQITNLPTKKQQKKQLLLSKQSRVNIDLKDEHHQNEVQSGEIKTPIKIVNKDGTINQVPLEPSEKRDQIGPSITSPQKKVQKEEPIIKEREDEVRNKENIQKKQIKNDNPVIEFHKMKAQQTTGIVPKKNDIPANLQDNKMEMKIETKQGDKKDQLKEKKNDPQGESKKESQKDKKQEEQKREPNLSKNINKNDKEIKKIQITTDNKKTESIPEKKQTKNQPSEIEKKDSKVTIANKDHSKGQLVTTTKKQVKPETKKVVKNEQTVAAGVEQKKSPKPQPSKSTAHEIRKEVNGVRKEITKKEDEKPHKPQNKQTISASKTVKKEPLSANKQKIVKAQSSIKPLHQTEAKPFVSNQESQEANQIELQKLPQIATTEAKETSRLTQSKASKQKPQQKQHTFKTQPGQIHSSHTSLLQEKAPKKQTSNNVIKPQKEQKRQMIPVDPLFLNNEITTVKKQFDSKTEIKIGSNSQISARPSSKQLPKNGGPKSKHLMQIKENREDLPVDSLENTKEAPGVKETSMAEIQESSRHSKKMSTNKSLLSKKELRAIELQKEMKKMRQKMVKIKQEESKKLLKQSNHLKKVYNL